jgi:hypothetical protein
VEVTSGPGRGTTVTLTLPEHPVAANGAAAAADPQPAGLAEVSLG